MSSQATFFIRGCGSGVAQARLIFSWLTVARATLHTTLSELHMIQSRMHVAQTHEDDRHGRKFHAPKLVRGWAVSFRRHVKLCATPSFRGSVSNFAPRVRSCALSKSLAALQMPTVYWKAFGQRPRQQRCCYLVRFTSIHYTL